ncbi:cytochrome C assembly family protein [Varunaivibrio sulfuroxidans]|uniref:ABC-type uncharacterized transport system permease subunit n=1 Tax=Varunaivibrio sulfuroxidans TaxID=1773489 RepID=A0A4R3J8I1_9PROT|nr:cytochrome c biogenesis protein CcsA [Varunaivibrio sulfuroxidans]TCS61226.1 ABC-type uncharacterized transport system permease subunit [Varunaivibrio sulfuroxidans]WES31153.1 cytochrome c biogenesis protein CcsA [Varunaivibrio sulfuroxidans]
MADAFIFSLAALLALVPVSIVSLRKNATRTGIFWVLLAVAVIGPVARTTALLSGTWHTGISPTLWVSISAAMVLFFLVGLFNREALRLTPLLAPYMFGMGLLALAWQHAPAQPLSGAVGGIGSWLEAHIVISVFTYGLVTIAAVAALGAVLQERALKTKRPTMLTRLLPSAADCERLQIGMLFLGEGLLALDLVTGMIAQYGETGVVMIFDHKTIFSLAAFCVIGVLIVARYTSAVRGRKAARMVLVAYLLLTLGYLGVKFVTDVLMVGGGA